MFEPLQKMLDKHGNNFSKILEDMRCHLALMVENTTARLEFDQFGSHAARDDDTVQIQNKDGCYWEVINTAVTSEEGNVGIYVGGSMPEGLVAVLAPIALPDGTKGASSNNTYYVPPQTTVFIVGKKAVTCNLQVRRLREHPEYERRKTISYDITSGDKGLQEPDRHRVPRTEKPDPADLRATSYRT